MQRIHLGSLCFVLSIVGALQLTLGAADNDTAPSSIKDNFDPKVNSWAEGTVMSLDAEGSKFSIRGARRPYASAYAKMRKELHDKTVDLTADESAKKAAAIRDAWQPDLEKLRKEEPGADTDFTFHLPAKDGKFCYFDETAFYGVVKQDSKPVTAAKLSEKEHNAMLALKDLKVGEYVVVGYEAGAIFNDAYVVIKANKPAGNETSDASITPRLQERATILEEVKNASALDPDTETARQIRQALIADRSLSIAAHNVNIKVENGTAQLKGSVNSAEEKVDVEKKAADIAGVGKVASELEVSAK